MRKIGTYRRTVRDCDKVKFVPLDIRGKRKIYMEKWRKALVKKARGYSSLFSTHTSTANWYEIPFSKANRNTAYLIPSKWCECNAVGRMTQMTS